MSDDIEKMIKTTIQTKVIEAFNTQPEMVEKLISAAFTKEVNEHGGPPKGYPHDKKMPYLDWLVGDELRRAAIAVVREYIEEQKPAVTKKVRESIQNADFGTPIGDQVAKLMSDEFRWGFKLEVAPHNRSDD